MTRPSEHEEATAPHPSQPTPTPTPISSRAGSVPPPSPAPGWHAEPHGEDDALPSGTEDDGGEPSIRDAEDEDASVRLLQSEGTDAPPEARTRRTGPGVHPGSPSSSFLADAVDVESEAPDEDGPSVEAPPIDPPGDPDIVARIRELEERLDRMIGAHARDPDPDDPAVSLRPQPRVSPSSRPPSRPSSPPFSRPSSPPLDPDGVLESARELLSSDFYLRKWGRMGLRNRSEEVDEFGYDPVYEQKVLPLFDFLYDKYFRVEVYGVERVPEEGRCLLVANHSGTLPFDGMMLRRAVRREHPQHREVRWLAEDGIFHFPFLGSFTNRVGAVRACQENAERLLDQQALVAVFPEGVKGIGKLFKERYRLQRFGRGGFIKLGLRTRTPVVPVAIVGGEETHPMLSRVDYLTRALGIPYLPVTPTFPWLGPLGLLPAPAKWKIFFGEPVDLQRYGAESADDELLVGRLTEQVRTTIQEMLDRAVGERRSVWFG
jgi:1-acyl-sn-glycerol-3-phosphate acyltransferase